MKTKITLFCLLIALSIGAKAQNYVTIPDSIFANWLDSNYSSCMNGNQMDTTCAGIQNTLFVNVGYLGIHDLTGIEYFVNLQYLVCDSNQLTSLPSLPGSLQYLYCRWNQLTGLPTLPNSLQLIHCYNNQLTSLPTLPNSLIQLYCNDNQLSNIPPLPNLIYSIWCYNNQLTYLPALPNSLYQLYCANNLLTNLPTLPYLLHELGCNGNQLTILPALPDSQLQVLECGKNHLTSLPTLPNSLVWLRCDSNNISCFPIFPSNMTDTAWFSISNNPFTCLPNYVPAMNPATLAYPLCVVGDTVNNPNGCGSSGNCSANFILYPDTIPHHYFATNNATGILPLTYLWSWGDSTYDSIAYPNHTYANAGFYTICLTITDSVGCTNHYCASYTLKTASTMAYVNVIPQIITGAANAADNKTLSIFPNPFTTQTTLTLPQTLQHPNTQTLFLYELTGRVVKQCRVSGSPYIIYRYGLAPGMYFLSVKEGERTVGTGKVVVED